VFGAILMLKSYPIFGSDQVLYNPDELIDLFLRCTADGICIVDMENRFIRINHMYTNIFGYTESDVIGRRFDEFRNLDILHEVIQQVKNGQAFTNMITQGPHKDGHILDIAVSYSPLRNKSGDIIAIIGIYRDITKEISMERELKKTREMYRLITENTTDMIKIYSLDKTIIYASPSHEKVMGFQPSELIGKNVFDIIISDEKGNLENMIKNLHETLTPQLFQTKIKMKNGSIFISETTVSPVLNDQNEIAAYVTVGRNITDRVENDNALRNLDRLSIIGQLAAGVAHEIRNPLTALKGFSKLLKTSFDKDKQAEYLSIITEELERIDIIVNEFMSLAKPQAIQFELNDLKSILDSTIKVLHPQAMLHNVQFNMKYQNVENVSLLCSPNQLKQVFVNIMKNAIEAMPHGGNILIDYELLQENRRIIIMFMDKGMGIDSNVLKYLGTPFYTTKDKGIGLGLTVSNKIIQEHNGVMKIDSHPGKGTTVRIELNYL
jgi:two-component system, sporulation sensor kinase A